MSKHKAGRELDELIAERVMGFEWRDVRARGETNTVRVLVAPTVKDIDGLYDRRSLEHPRHQEYSTDILAAWRVMEKMREARWYPEVGWDWDHEQWECCMGHTVYDAYFGYADTAPLAICRAALAAMEVPA